MCGVFGVFTAPGGTRAIVKAMLTTATAMSKQLVTQGRTGTVQAHCQCTRPDAQIGCDHRAVFLVDVDPVNQYGVRRAQFGY